MSQNEKFYAAVIVACFTIGLLHSACEATHGAARAVCDLALGAAVALAMGYARSLGTR